MEFTRICPVFSLPFHFPEVVGPTYYHFSSGVCTLWRHAQPNSPVSRTYKLLNIALPHASPNCFHPSKPETRSWASSASRTFISVHEGWCNLWPFSNTILQIILDCVWQPRSIIYVCNIQILPGQTELYLITFFFFFPQFCFFSSEPFLLTSVTTMLLTSTRCFTSIFSGLAAPTFPVFSACRCLNTRSRNTDPSYHFVYSKHK